jgi:hypothetical protein
MFMATYIAGQTMAQVSQDMLQNAQLLGGLVNLIGDEDMASEMELNTALLLEAAFRCVDCVEVIVESSVAASSNQSERREEFAESSTGQEVARIREVLDKMRADLLGMGTID